LYAALPEPVSVGDGRSRGWSWWCSYLFHVRASVCLWWSAERARASGRGGSRQRDTPGDVRIMLVIITDACRWAQ